MVQLGAAVELHKKQSKSLIKSSEISFLIVLPMDRVSSGVNPLYGDLNRELLYSGTEIGPIKCLWFDALSASSGGAFGIESTINRMAGHYTEATVFAEVWLEDVLLDSLQPDGDTWFDKAKLIKRGKLYYTVLGYVRIGLPTSSPYLAVVALKGGSGYGTE